ncbi:ABC transporter permease [Intestinibacter sp.]|uniref:ABC transporter permease n=1 Tax=Intestinibacter sp. TaxID=1965304 RepID=UPI003F17DA97
MRAIRVSFLQMLLFIRRDMILFVACFAPLMAGIAFKFIIPFVEKTLVNWTSINSILSPYYGIFDLFFSMIAPTMFCFIAAMVILEERDDHIQSYLFITRLGKIGYLISRICIPAVIAFAITVLSLAIFKLTALCFTEILFLSISGTLQGIIIALIIVTLSTNKLEGMAVTKLSTLTILGILGPYFLPSNAQYVLSFLPSFWIAKSIYDKELIYMILSIFISSVWIFILLKKFKKKIL